MNFRDLANRAGLHEFHHAPVVAAGVDLIAHLRGASGRARRVGDDAYFGHRPRQRLLAIHMATAAQSPDSAHRVGVVGRADDNSVDVLLLQQPAKVAVAFRAGELLPDVLQVVLIDIAQRHDVFATDTRDIARAAAGDADDGEVELAVGRDALLGAENRGGRGESGGEGGFLEKGTTAKG